MIVNYYTIILHSKIMKIVQKYPKINICDEQNYFAPLEERTTN